MPYFTQPDPIDAYFEIAASKDMAELTKVTRSEISHYYHIFEQPSLRDPNCFKDSKESIVYALLQTPDFHVRKIPKARLLL